MHQRYLIALGSNKRHHRHGRPRAVLAAASASLTALGVQIVAVSPTIRSTPLGPSRRAYANGVALIDCALPPEDLLALLKQIEAAFGRKAGGQRWSPRVLDLDIVLWSGGAWASDGLTIPHPAFRARRFVLDPAVAVAPRWRDPVTGLTLRQLAARLSRARPCDGG